MQVDHNVKFTFKEMKKAPEEDKEAIFKTKLEHLNKILAAIINPSIKLPEGYYANVIRKISMAPLTDQQLQEISEVFNHYRLQLDYGSILALRMFFNKTEGWEKNLPEILRIIHAYQIWDKVRPKIDDGSITQQYNRTYKSFEEMVQSKEPLEKWFTFKKSNFDEILKKLEQILAYPQPSLPEGYYEKVFRKCVKVELNQDQEVKLCNAFTERNEFLASRMIYHYDPNKEGAQEKIDAALELIQKCSLWNIILPKLEALSPNYHGQIAARRLETNFEAKLESLEHQNASAQLREWLIDQNLKKLVQMLVYRMDDKGILPASFYEEVIEDIIHAVLTKEQEKAICDAFKEHGFVNDAWVISIARSLDKYEPGKELDADLKAIHEYQIWDRIQPKLEALTPHHVQIVKEYEESLKPLLTLFTDMVLSLGSWKTSEGTAAAVQLVKKFEAKHKYKGEYKTLNWEALYALIENNSSILSKKEKNDLLNVYLNAYKSKPEKTPFDEVKIDILSVVINEGKQKIQLIEKQLENLKPEELLFIAGLCARECTNGDETTIWKALPKGANDHFLVERFKVLCQNKDLECLKALFDDICYKLYYYRGKQIEEKTFFSIVEYCFHHLTPEEIEAIKKAPYFLKYVDLDFDCCFAMAMCTHLSRLEDKETAQLLLDKIKVSLNALADKYAAASSWFRALDVAEWERVYNHVKSLNLPDDLFIPLLEIFTREKDPTTKSGSAITSLYNSWTGAKSPEANSEWQGGILNTTINALQNWVEVNSKWIKEKNQEKANNTKDMIKIVDDLLKYLSEVKVDCTVLTKEEIIKHNLTLHENQVELTKKLRAALKNKEFENAVDLYVAVGREKSSGSAEILIELCKHFKRINKAALIVKLKKYFIRLGFEELAKTKRDVAFLAQAELLRFRNPLDLPFDLQQKALEGLPKDIKNLYFDLIGKQDSPLGSFPCSLLSLKDEDEENEVNIVQIMGPKGSQGINPEFTVFNKNERRESHLASLFILLQSGNDEAWIKEQVNSTKENNFFTSFFDKGPFFMQEGTFANDSLYPTFTNFEQAITEEFFKPGNCLLKESWIGSNDFKRDFNKCIKDVKKIFFPFTEALSAAERRIFIKLFHIRFAFEKIKFADAKTFGFIGDNAGAYNCIMIMISAIIYDKQNAVAFEDDSFAFTFEELGKAFVNGPVRKANGATQDELAEVIALLNDSEVQERLIKNKDDFGFEEMSYPDFTLNSIDY